MLARFKIHFWLIAIIVAFVALLAGPRDEPVAYAQGDGRDYVDVALVLEAPFVITTYNCAWVDIIVVNQGTRPAYDVEVVVDLVYPDKSYFLAEGARVASRTIKPPVGAMTLDDEKTSLHWTIPKLGGLQREVFKVCPSVVIANSLGRIIHSNWEIPHEFFGKVTTASFESERHKGNNTSRIWSYDPSLLVNNHLQVATEHTVGVSVDQGHPSPGDTVNFTVTASRVITNRGPELPAPIDLKVDIELTDGLAHAGAPSYHSLATGRLGARIPSPASVIYRPLSYRNGVFDIGTGTASENRKSYSVTLPIRVSSDAVVNEQCLTAKLTGNPPPGTGRYDDDISDNVAMLCLGVQPASPLLSSEVNAFTIYPCVGNTDSPCDDTDDVRVRAVHNISEPGLILGAGKAFIHARDNPNRKYDSHANSVNTGDKVSWQIPVIWNGDEMSAVHEQWTNYRDGFSAGGTNDGAPPRPGSYASIRRHKLCNNLQDDLWYESPVDLRGYSWL